MTFEVEGGKAAAFALMNALTLVDISNNLGDAKSLTTHPATTTHRRLSPRPEPRSASRTARSACPSASRTSATSSRTSTPPWPQADARRGPDPAVSVAAHE